MLFVQPSPLKETRGSESMAACGSLQHIFDKPLSDQNPTLLESLSPWKAIKNLKPVENSSFTEIFGELHFKENQVESSSSPDPCSFSLPESSSSPCSPLSTQSLPAEFNQGDGVSEERPDNVNIVQRSKSSGSSHKKHYKNSDSFSSESLSLCTEGLGFESSDDVEDLANEASFDSQHPEEKMCSSRPESVWKESKRSRTNKGSFPPPISCIGRTGKPWVCLKSYRQDGRFILQEIRFPTQEFLHACREGGRLRLQYIQSDEEDDAFEDIEEVNEENVDDDDDDDDDFVQHIIQEEYRDDDAHDTAVEMGKNHGQDILASSE